jgi:hypothetical protein
MAHGDAIVDADGIELKWHTTCRANSLFYQFAEGLQVDMAGYYIHIGIAYGDKGLVEIIFPHHTGRTQQATVWSSFESELDLI